MNPTPVSISSLASLPLLALALLAAGCDTPQKPAQSFRLPDGDTEQGKAAFVKLQCHACHVVQGVELPAPGSKSPITVVLGGEVLRVKTYGELVTSIINPNHIVSEKYRGLLTGGHSPMPEYNESMTVSQMINLVTFIQPHYQKLQPETWMIH